MRAHSWLIFSLLLACEGVVGDPGSTGSRTVPPIPDEIIDPEAPDDVGASDFRRLSPTELRNSLELITGLTLASGDSIPAENAAHGYDRVSAGYAVSGDQVDAFEALADEIADQWIESGIRGAASCVDVPPGGPAEAEACAREVAELHAELALRREVRAADLDALVGKYRRAEVHEDGLRWLAHGLFRHPEFIYVIEGRGSTPGAGTELGDYDIATRLSLALCERTPDAELLAAVRDGSLENEAGVAQQAERLFDTCSGPTIENFFGQWLELEDTLTASPSDRSEMPEFTDDFIFGMDEEWRAYLNHVVYVANGSFQEFLSADYTVASDKLAAVYDFAELSEEPQRVDLPATRRGILNQPAFLARFHRGDETHPIQRGVFLLKALTCFDIPMEEMVSFPPNTPGLSNRDRWDEHTRTPQCVRCHGVINPAGFLFEDFDSMGRHRTMDGDFEVDASGGLSTIDADSLNGGASASEALAGSEDVAQCFARQWFRFGMARVEERADASSVRRITDRLVEGASLREVLIELTSTYSFRHRRASAMPAPDTGEEP